MAIHVDPNKSAQWTTIRLCFSQECPVIYRNFSGIIFLTIPGPSAAELVGTKRAKAHSPGQSEAASSITHYRRIRQQAESN